MNKVIIVLSGTPDGKNSLLGIARNNFWVRNSNPKDSVTGVLSRFLYYLTEEKGEGHYKFISNLISMLDKEYNFQEQFVTDVIQKFLSDEKDFYEDENKRKFYSMILFIHGIGADITSMLKQEYGVFQIHVTKRSLNTNIERYDFVLYEDNENFENDCINTLNTLIGGK